MRKLLGSVLLFASLFVVGCGEDVPDPREQEGFVDTTDPSKVMGLPQDPNADPTGGGTEGAPKE